MKTEMDVSVLYPSVFKMIRGKAKSLNKKVRFQKEVHILLCNKIQNQVEHFLFEAYKKSKGKLDTQHFEIKNQKEKTKIYKTRRNGKRYADIIEMIRQDRAIIPISKIEKVTKQMVTFFHSKPYLISKKIYPIIQCKLEEIIFSCTKVLLDLMERKNKTIIKNHDVSEI